MKRTNARRRLTNCADFFEQNNPELRLMARQHFRNERRDHTLQPTALVDEAFIRLQTSRLPKAASSRQFFAMASRVMGRILIEHARRRNALKRGGNWHRVTLEDADGIAGGESDILAIKMAISRLAAHDAALAQLAELRLVGGFSTKEAASILGRGASTVRRDWRRAEKLLHQDMFGTGQK